MYINHKQAVGQRPALYTRRDITHVLAEGSFLPGNRYSIYSRLSVKKENQNETPGPWLKKIINENSDTTNRLYSAKRPTHTPETMHTCSA